MLIILDW